MVRKEATVKRLTFDEFVDEVRVQLSLLGLPTNWQPGRESFHRFYAQRRSVRACADYFKPRIKQYKIFTNGGCRG